MDEVIQKWDADTKERKSDQYLGLNKVMRKCSDWKATQDLFSIIAQTSEIPLMYCHQTVPAWSMAMTYLEFSVIFLLDRLKRDLERANRVIIYLESSAAQSGGFACQWKEDMIQIYHHGR